MRADRAGPVSDGSITGQLTNFFQIQAGGGERIRTDDLLRARQALSQLSYTPQRFGSLERAVVGLDGVEPSTSRLSGVRSNRTELQAHCRIA